MNIIERSLENAVSDEDELVFQFFELVDNLDIVRLSPPDDELCLPDNAEIVLGILACFGIPANLL